VPPGAFGAPAAPGSGILPPIANNLDRVRGEPQPPFARPSSFVPPVLRDQGFNMEETEARAAINWINWLQAQGARQQGAPGQQMFGTGPLPPPPPMQPPAATAGPAVQPLVPPQPNGSQPVREAPEDWSRRTGGAPSAGMPATGAPTSGSLPTMQTGPLPPAEELRAMFAQLQPDTASSRVVEGAIVSSSAPIDEKPTAELFPPSESSASQGDTLTSDEGQHDEVAASGSHHQDIWGEEPYAGSSTALPSWTIGEAASAEAGTHDAVPDWAHSSVDAATSAPAGAQAHDLTDLYSLYTAPDDEHANSGESPASVSSSSHDEYDRYSQHDEPALAGESAARATGAPAPVTLESLERGFAESGFQPFRLPSSESAAAAEGGDALASTSNIRELYGLTDEPSVPPAAYAPMDAASAASSGTFAFDGGDAWAANVAPAPEPAAPEPEPQQTRKVVDDLAPDDHPARLERARQRRGDGQIDDALTDYRHVLRNAPDMLDDVVKDLEETMADAPDHPEIHRLLGDARIRQGDYLSALESYNRAVALTQAQGN
jgi:hypothetical protein